MHMITHIVYVFKMPLDLLYALRKLSLVLAWRQGSACSGWLQRHLAVPVGLKTWRKKREHNDKKGYYRT